MSKSGAFAVYGCNGLAQGGSSFSGPVPGHFQLEKPLGFQGEANLQLLKKYHDIFLAKFPICEDSSCTPQSFPDAFKALVPPWMHWASPVLEQQEQEAHQRRKGHSFQQGIAGRKLIEFL